MEDKLPVSSFQRIHKSYIVNIDHIDKYTTDEVEIGGKTLPVGKTYKEILLSRLEGKNI
jgi:DNA-binding LytR/AlgR family response regulator